ncbi:MAG: hypothetical protein KC486_16635 [Myxococcales bacterium]|nr:hypothetical protein [Myxococcales bacterium]
MDMLFFDQLLTSAADRRLSAVPRQGQRSRGRSRRAIAFASCHVRDHPLVEFRSTRGDLSLAGDLPAKSAAYRSRGCTPNRPL